VERVNCPRCQQLLRRSDNGAGLSEGMPEGTVVLGCLNCRQFTIEGSGKWVGAGDGFRESLRILAAQVKQERDTQKAIMTSDINDPRWEAWV
jgi:hypothetical protein